MAKNKVIDKDLVDEVLDDLIDAFKSKYENDSKFREEVLIAIPNQYRKELETKGMSEELMNILTRGVRSRCHKIIKNHNDEVEKIQKEKITLAPIEYATEVLCNEIKCQLKEYYKNNDSFGINRIEIEIHESNLESSKIGILIGKEDFKGLSFYLDLEVPHDEVFDKNKLNKLIKETIDIFNITIKDEQQQ